MELKKLEEVQKKLDEKSTLLYSSKPLEEESMSDKSAIAKLSFVEGYEINDDEGNGLQTTF